MRFITLICIMGLIGPQCVFSGVSGTGGWGGGAGSGLGGGVDQEKSETSARIHLLDWRVMRAAGSNPRPRPPPGCFDCVAWRGRGLRLLNQPPFNPKCAVTVGPNRTSHLFTTEELEAQRGPAHTACSLAEG